MALSTICLGILGSSKAGLGPENVAVVVNGDSWASLTVANEYAQLRGIPANNFIVLHGLSAVETTDVDHFRAEILGPVFKAIGQRGLTNQIDCVAYSVDIPYAVNVTSDMAGRKFSMVITGMASTNGLTYLHEWVEKKDTDYLRLDINRYDRRTLPLPMGSGLSKAENEILAQGMSLYEQKQYVKAAELLSGLLTQQRSDPDIAYNLACCQALAGQPDKAMDALRSAVASGWRNAYQLTSDPDLVSLAKRDDLKQLIERVKAMPVRVQPGVPFRSRYAWSPSGEPASSGPHYMLSTFLGVTAGRGNSVKEVLDCLQRSAAADGTMPKGTIYFPKNGDVRSTTRQWAFKAAADELKQMGVNAIVEDGVLPQNRSDVAGATIGISDFDWKGSKSTVLPGAIIEHLTSFGGIISERAGQSPCTDFIRAGASGSSGTVTEPYALQQKFPTAFIHVQYAQGFTLAESFYQSLYGPYQLLVIGDPLCKPWFKPTRFSLAGLSDGAPIKGKVMLSPKAAGTAAIAVFEFYVDGRLLATAAPGTPVAFDTRTVPDGAHSISVEAILKGTSAGCSRSSVTVRVINQKHAVSASAEKPAGWTLGEPIAVKVRCEGATSIGLMHLGRSVGSVSGASGTIEVPTISLGTGISNLVPVAQFASGASAVGSAMTVSVAPPSANAVSASASPSGLTLSVDGAAPVTVKDTIDWDWLAKLAPGASRHFTLVGDFDVPAADLYQVQVKTNTGASVAIDGVGLAHSNDESQQLAPVMLSTGRHRLKVIGITPANPTLDIRLGAAGAFHLTDAMFKH